MQEHSENDNMKKCRILVIYNEIPVPFNGGVRTYYLIRELAKYNRVTLLTLPPSRNYEENLKSIQKYCEVIIAPCFIEEFKKRPLMEFISYLTKAAALKTRRAIPVGNKLIIKYNYQLFCLKKELIKILAKRTFDFIQIEHPYLADIIKDIKTNAVRIINFHNVHSSMKQSPLQKKIVRQYEKNLKNYFDFCICCSETDRERLSKLGFHNAIVVPNGVDTKYYAISNNKKNKGLVFIGNLTYKPNRDGLKYFFNKIYPKLPKNLQIRIIGRYFKNEFIREKHLHNVEFLGFVKDARPYLSNSITFVPLLDGGGTRVKILTAFATGTPVVSTTKGAEGIGYTRDKDLLIADNPDQFAQRLIGLANQKEIYSKFQKNGRRLAIKYDWKRIGREYHNHLMQNQREN